MVKMRVTHKERYWRKRLQNEADGMARNVLLAKRSLNIGSKRYPVGSILPSKELPPKTLAALIDSRGAVWVEKQVRAYPQPVDLPKPVAAPPRPQVRLVDDPDITDAWRFSEAAMVKACNGDHALARDILFSDPAARDLYKRATVEQCRKIAKRLGRPSVDPNTAWASI
jgi:hypothetical protein